MRRGSWLIVCTPRRQAGVAAVEFALIASVLFTLLIGIMEMGRVLFYWNASAEATRWGARLAVVCSQTDASVIKAKMRLMVPVVPADHIEVLFDPLGCTIDDCERVTVSILPGVTINTVIPFVPLSLSVPPFSTSLPRESMDSAGGPNGVCG